MTGGSIFWCPSCNRGFTQDHVTAHEFRVDPPDNSVQWTWIHFCLSCIFNGRSNQRLPIHAGRK